MTWGCVIIGVIVVYSAFWAGWHSGRAAMVKELKP